MPTAWVAWVLKVAQSFDMGGRAWAVMAVLAAGFGLVAPRHAAVRDARAASPDGLLRLSDASMSLAEPLASAAAAEFSSVVLFTADGPQIPCPACAPALREFRVAARSWEAAAVQGFRPVYFFVASYDESALTTFRRFQVRSVPMVAVRPAGALSLGGWAVRPGKPADLAAGNTTISAPMSSDGSAVSAPRVLALMYAAGASPRLLASRPGQELRPLALATAVVAAAVAALLAGAPHLRRRFVVCHPHAWTVGVALVHLVAISGVVFDVVRAPPLLGADAAGAPVVLDLADRKGQFVVEGLMMGGVSVSASLALIGALWCAREQRSEPLQLAGVASLLGLAAALVLRYVALYEAKTGWYRAWNTVPQEWRPLLLAASGAAGGAGRQLSALLTGSVTG